MKHLNLTAAAVKSQLPSEAAALAHAAGGAAAFEVHVGATDPD